MSWYRARKLFTSQVRRIVRWEFWPMWVFYIPLVICMIPVTLRYRGLTFLAVNPGFSFSGVVGDKKSLALSQLQEKQAKYIATFEDIPCHLPTTEKVQKAKAFMLNNNYDFPIVLKPNYGQRGLDVAIVRDEQQMQYYLEESKEDIIIQEFIPGEEFGVFYYRLPNEPKGRILSITEKRFPTLIGDGQSTLETLILENPRTHYMAKYLLELHSQKLSNVLGAGEIFKSVEIGAHSRGTLFLDANEMKTDAMVERFDDLSNSVDGFFFGRYDIRVPSYDDFRAGKQIKVLELNGVTAEAAHMYDPKHGVLYAYKTLIKQWEIAYRIGANNIATGLTPKTGLFALLRHLKLSLS